MTDRRRDDFPDVSDVRTPEDFRSLVDETGMGDADALMRASADTAIAFDAIEEAFPHADGTNQLGAVIGVVLGIAAQRYGVAKVREIVARFGNDQGFWDLQERIARQMKGTPQ